MGSPYARISLLIIVLTNLCLKSQTALYNQTVLIVQCVISNPVKKLFLTCFVHLIKWHDYLNCDRLLLKKTVSAAIPKGVYGTEPKLNHHYENSCHLHDQSRPCVLYLGLQLRHPFSRLHELLQK